MSGFDGLGDDMHEELAQGLAEEARDAGVSIDEIELEVEDPDGVGIDVERVRQRAREIVAGD